MGLLDILAKYLSPMANDPGNPSSTWGPPTGATYKFSGLGGSPAPAAPQTPYERMKQRGLPEPMTADQYPSPAGAPLLKKMAPASPKGPDFHTQIMERGGGFTGGRASGMSHARPSVPDLESGISGDLPIYGGADVGYNAQAVPSNAGEQPSLPTSAIQSLMGELPQGSTSNPVSAGTPSHNLFKTLLRRLI